jgi:putative ABC transport system permease protein
MNIFNAIIEGVRDLWSHKFRSVLTILGVVLGASALMTMDAITEGIAVSMRYQMLSTGDHIKIRLRNTSPPPDQLSMADTSAGLTTRDVLAIKQNIDLVDWVSPETEMRILATFENKRDRTTLKGVTAGILKQDMHEQPIGRFFSDLDIENKNRVCLLGGRVYEKLFPDNYENAIGATIRINGIAFKVIGIFPFYLNMTQQRELESGEYQRKLERENKQKRRDRFILNDSFPWKNDAVMIPITTFQDTFKSEASSTQLIGDDVPLNGIQIGSRDPERMDELIQRVRSLLLITHKGIEDFQIEHSLDRLKEVDLQAASARLSGTIIAGIGLIVGGVGIANIMLASIADRIREIGIRRAIGARGADIFFQVIMEALMLGLIGGVVGVGTGCLLIYILDEVVQIPNQPILTWGAVAFSFGFSLITGLLAGIYPAAKASALSPVEALRYN